MKPRTPEEAKAFHTLLWFAHNLGSKAVKRRHAMEAAKVVLRRLEAFEIEERKKAK